MYVGKTIATSVVTHDNHDWTEFSEVNLFYARHDKSQFAPRDARLAVAGEFSIAIYLVATLAREQGISSIFHHGKEPLERIFGLEKAKNAPDLWGTGRPGFVPASGLHEATVQALYSALALSSPASAGTAASSSAASASAMARRSASSI